MSSLIEMPDLVMEKIVGFSDFKSVLTLRQVCRDTRKFIDVLRDSKLPDSKFKQIRIRCDREKSDNRIVLNFKDTDNGFPLFEYSEIQHSRKFQNKTTDLGSSNVVNVAVRDLETILKFQKSILKGLRFVIAESRLQNEESITTLMIKLNTMVTNLNRRIKTKTLSITSYDASQVIPILQLADPETLENIYIFSLDKESEMSDEMVKTEQWKTAEKLYCEFFLMNLNVEDVCHFSSINLKTNSLDARNFATLKKTFVSSSKFKGARIEVKSFNEQGLSNIWGPAFVFDCARHWYFRMKDLEENVLDIKICNFFGRPPEYCVIFVDILEIRKVPDGAIVHDYKEN